MKRVKWLDKECNSCGARLNSWDARISKTLAYTAQGIKLSYQMAFGTAASRS